MGKQANKARNTNKQPKTKQKEAIPADSSTIDDIFKSAKQKKIIQKQSVDPQ